MERQLAWLSGLQQRLLAAMTEHSSIDVDGVDREWVRDDLACALRLSARSAAHRLRIATELTTRLPGTLQQLEAGAISGLQARLLTEEVARLDDQAAAVVEAAVLPRAPQQTVTQFRRSLSRAVLAVDTRSQESARADAMAERRVCFTPRSDAMTELWALLPTEGAAAIMATLDAKAAAAGAEDERTCEQRRADALIELACHALHDTELPEAHGAASSRAGDSCTADAARLGRSAG
jgi:hypothetical protein